MIVIKRTKKHAKEHFSFRSNTLIIKRLQDKNNKIPFYGKVKVKGIFIENAAKEKVIVIQTTEGRKNLENTIYAYRFFVAALL